VFSFGMFMVSGHTFTSLIHFELIFAYGARKRSSFFLLYVAVQFSQHYLLKRLFPTGYSFLCCQRLIDHIVMGLVLGFLFCSINLGVDFGVTTIYLIITAL